MTREQRMEKLSKNGFGQSHLADECVAHYIGKFAAQPAICAKSFFHDKALKQGAARFWGQLKMRAVKRSMSPFGKEVNLNSASVSDKEVKKKKSRELVNDSQSKPC